MSVFDPDSFLHTEIDSALETSIIPIPEGEHLGMIDEVTADTIKTQNGPAPVMYVHWHIISEEVKEATGLDKPMIRQIHWLRIDDNGQLEFGTGKNIGIGAIRDALGQNVDGEPWSPSRLVGEGPCMLKVGHRYNKETGEGPYADVRRVSAAE